MWLKKKDKVVVLSGKDKGKRGEVLHSSGSEKYLVAKLNMAKKHQKPRKDEAAGIVEKEIPMHQSKLMLVCPQCDTPTSPKMSFLENGMKVRTCRNCSETIE